MTRMKNGWDEDEYGTKWHYVNDAIHNDNGPAIIFHDGLQVYCQHGKDHREDGPAEIWPNGDVCYFLFGIEVTEEQLAIMGLEDYPKEGFTKDQVIVFGLHCMG